MRNAFGSLAIASVVALGISACGGKETVAEKSARAFAEAQKKGTPAGAERGEQSATATMPPGMDHSTIAGDQATTSGQDAMAGMDHSNMPGMTAGRDNRQGGASMAGMDHSNMKGMDHSNMPGTQRGPQRAQRNMAGMDHSNMAGMDHSNMPGMQQRRTAEGQQQSQSMAGMDHSNMPGMQQRGTAQNQPQTPTMAGMDHSNMAGMDHSSMAGMQSGAASERILPSPTSNAQIQQLRPSVTLKGDMFDAAAPVAVQEAIKSAQGGGTEGQESREITPGQDHENPPTPAPAFRDVAAPGIGAMPARSDHTEHGRSAAPASGRQMTVTAPAVDHSAHGKSAAPTQQRARSKPTSSRQPAPAAAALYACPMHPEVTSNKPGTCPKCGMALVKKK